MKKLGFTFLLLFVSVSLSGQEIVKDIDRLTPLSSDIYSLAYVNDTLYFSTCINQAVSLWKMDTNENSPILIKTFPKPDYSNYLTFAVFFKGIYILRLKVITLIPGKN